MKRLMFILFLAITAAALVIALRSSTPRRAWNPGTRMVFLGFIGTNATMPGTNAWFGISNVPSGTASWRTSEISQRRGTRWRAWDPLPASAFNWQYPQPTGFTLGAVVPVQSTSAPIRIVVEIKRERAGFGKQLYDLWVRLTSSLGFSKAGPRGGIISRPSETYFVTNEINLRGLNPP